jgi:hypothetical protein
MNKLFLLVIFLLFVSSTYGQSTDGVPLEVYKTFDDFFGGNKIRIADCTTSKNGCIFKCQGVKIDLTDSAFAGYTFGKTEGWDKNKREIFDEKAKLYYPYLGGCKKLMVIIPSHTTTVIGNFREDGNFLSGEVDFGTPAEFIKDLDFKHNRSFKIEDALADNPEVLKQYLAEKEATKKTEWSRNRLLYAIKYADLYCGK